MSANNHRSGVFKQVNKKYKHGRHRTKGEISRDAKGRSGSQKKVNGRGAKLAKALTRADRVSLRKQLRQRHASTLSEQCRGEGGAARPPHLVTVLSLDNELLSTELVERLCGADETAAQSAASRPGVTYLNVPRFKTRYGFLCANPERLEALFDCLCVSDVLLLLWPTAAAEDVEAHRPLLDLLLAHGFPEPMHVVAGMPPPGKQREQLRKALQRAIAKWHNATTALYFADSNSDQMQILRQLATVRKKRKLEKYTRPQLLVENVGSIADSEEAATLMLSGYVREAPLNVNKLVYVPGVGDCQLQKITDDEGQLKMEAASVKSGSDDEPAHVTGLSPCAIKDEEEIKEEASDAMSVDSGVKWADQMLDQPNDVNELARFRKEAADEDGEEDDPKLADIIDLPAETKARVQLQKYRGLKSFRTSPWDAKENLPADYARIYKFGSFKQTKKLAAAEFTGDYAEEKAGEVSLPGTFVTLHIARVSLAAIDALKQSTLPLVVTGLLRHEQKFSLMNVVLRKSAACEASIRNKQPLTFCVGYRRFETRAIFSQHTNGDKYKMERFMPRDAAFVASFFAPIMFGPAPALVFTRDVAGRPQLVAHGCTGEPNPDRVVLKRAILRGYPHKIMNRAAVVRFMFFNKEDVDWFKPVEIFTGSGNVGHIKDSLGTHGALKCVFNLPLRKQEVIKMALYKRVFPPWTYMPLPFDAATAADASDASAAASPWITPLTSGKSATASGAADITMHE